RTGDGGIRRKISRARRPGQGLREGPDGAGGGDRVRERGESDRGARQPGLPGSAEGARRRGGTRSADSRRALGSAASQIRRPKYYVSDTASQIRRPRWNVLDRTRAKRIPDA